MSEAQKKSRHDSREAPTGHQPVTDCVSFRKIHCVTFQAYWATLISRPPKGTTVRFLRCSQLESASTPRFWSRRGPTGEGAEPSAGSMQPFGYRLSHPLAYTGQDPCIGSRLTREP